MEFYEILDISDIQESSADAYVTSTYSPNSLINKMKLDISLLYKNKLNSFQPSVACHIQTGLYMKCKTGLKWVNKNSPNKK